MKIFRFSNFQIFLALMAPRAAVAAPDPGATNDRLVTSSPTVAAVGEGPKSVFVDRADFGRDPFFPKSERRGRVVVTNQVVTPLFTGGLALKGISGGVDKPLAIINNKTFEVGEESEIRIGGHYVKVKCAEIREKSVVVVVNGVSKELFLGPKL